MAPTSLMADAHGLLLKTRQDGGPALNVLQNNKGQPLAGTIFNVALALMSTSVLSALFSEPTPKHDLAPFSLKKEERILRRFWAGIAERKD